MTGRSDLIAAATVGTAHRSIDLPGLPPGLRPEPMPVDPAAALLDAAALSALARRTVPRWIPEVVGTHHGPAPETLPVVPDVVRQVLSRVSNQPVILLEALNLIQQAGCRLPPELVPGLFDDARPEVVAAARSVAGEIGRLLTIKNPRWAAPAVPDPADRRMWDEGTTAERLSWVRALRQVNPDAARNLLSDNFLREGATARAEFLGILAERLSGADQDFLLVAARDRSRLVIAAALDLLTQLPDSPLRQDMRALASRHLRVDRRLLRGTVTVRGLSAEDFAPWPVVDGVPWSALLGHIDPAEWPQIFGGDLLTVLANGTEDLTALLPGFRLAAITFRSSALARVLVDLTISRAGPKTPPVVDSELWAVLDPTDATALLDRLLDVPAVRPDQVATAVTLVATPWPTALAWLLIQWLPTGGPAGAPAPRALWDRWATSLSPADCRAMADLARAALPAAAGDQGSALITRVSSAANLLTLRAVLYETLCPPGGTSE